MGAIESQPERRPWREARGSARKGRRYILPFSLLTLALAALAIALLQSWPLPLARINVGGDARPAASQRALTKAKSMPALVEVVEGDLDGPLAVAVDSSGHIFAADSGHGLIKVFSAEGRLQRVIGQAKGWEPQAGELAYPVGLALDDNGRLYVADNVGKHISVFRADSGEFIGWLGEQGAQGQQDVKGARGEQDALGERDSQGEQDAPDDQGAQAQQDAQGEQDAKAEHSAQVKQKPFDTPGGLFYRDGELYVTDLGQHRVVVLDLDGNLRRQLGTGKGQGPGEMIYPNYVWVDSEGSAYVADSNNNRVQVFNRDGVQTRIISGPLQLPRGLVMDAGGRLYVASTMSQRVEIFDRDGSYLVGFGDTGGYTLTAPNGLAIYNNLLIVADRGNSRIAVWRLGQ